MYPPHFSLKLISHVDRSSKHCLVTTQNHQEDSHSLNHLAQDIGVTAVKDDHGANAEQLTASGAELQLNRVLVLLQTLRKVLRRNAVWEWGTYVVAVEVVDGALGQHGVVLELGLAERRGVAGDEDQLGLAHAELLERGLVSKDDCARVLVLMLGGYFHEELGNVPLPDFITSARRELMVSPDFLSLREGAISRMRRVEGRVVVGWRLAVAGRKFVGFRRRKYYYSACAFGCGELVRNDTSVYVGPAKLVVNDEKKYHRYT